ncbi:hypothetical protein TNCV_4056191 [Trichonephila clavipes]|nr:hypothetical protein TNCV_4056191 [Trichonephila clavipes]
MLIQSACSVSNLVRCTVVLLENSITARIKEQHKRIELTTQQLYVPKCIEGGDGPTQPADFRSVVSSSHMYVLENGSLVIRDVEKQDAGSYLCEASNGVGESLAEVVKLSVNEKDSKIWDAFIAGK